MNAIQKRLSTEDVKVENLLKRFPTLEKEVVIRELENTRGHAGEAAKRLKEEVSNASLSGDASSGIVTPKSEQQGHGELTEPEMQKSLHELRDSLLKFRTDLEDHFIARRRHALSCRKLHEFASRSRKMQYSSYSVARDKLGEALIKPKSELPLKAVAETPDDFAEEVERPPSGQWSTNWVFHCCKSGEESVFKGKAPLLDAHIASSVRIAVELLNAGSLDCSDDLCIVYSAMHGAYFALYRHRKRQKALQRLGIIDRMRGKFSARIIAAHNLRAAEGSGNASDPFVVARIGNQEYNTKRISNNLNPVWNSEWFRFHVDTWEPSKQALHLHVFDRSNFTHDKSLGSCKVDIRKLDLRSGQAVRRREVLEGSNGGEIEFDMVFEPETESEEPLKEVEKLKKHIGDGVYICILGGTSFALEETKGLMVAVAEGLCNAFGSRARFITGGMHGVQEIFAKHCGDGNHVFNLLPVGHVSGYGAGSDIHTQGNLESRKTIFALMGDIYITAEGGPGVVQEASTAFSRGACVVPLMRTGGASSGMFGFPAKALERPPFASEEHWEILKSNTSTSAEAAGAVISIVEGFLAVQEGAIVLSPRVGKSGGAMAVSEPEESALRTVGITGVGRLEAESPDAKMTSIRRELNMSEVGGEEAVRKLVITYLSSGAPADEQVPDISDDQIQELWVNESNADTAIVSALYACRPQGVRGAPRIDCRQFRLQKEGSSWRVEKMLHPEAGRALEKDFASTAVVEEQKEKKGVCAGSPKRKAPPPLDDFSTEEASASVPAVAPVDDDATSTLVEAVRHGLEIVETSKTPRALFNGLAIASSGSDDPMVSQEKFAHFVSMYGGRSPAAHGGEKLSEDLFEQLAVQNDAGEKGVPYDIFCTELCPGRAPDAVLRMSGKRAALLRDLQGAVKEEKRTSQIVGSLGHIVGSEPLEEADFRSVVERLLSVLPDKVADPVAVKALWCDLVRGRKTSRQLEPSVLLKVLGEGASAAVPARSPLACPPMLDEALTSDDKAIEASAAKATDTALAAEEADEEAAIGKLIEAMRFGIAIDPRTPRDLFDLVSTSPANTGAGSALTISRADFLPFAARLSGGNSLDTENKRLCPEDAAAALFEELACPSSDGILGVHYELFVAQVCLGPDRAAEAYWKIDKRRKTLMRDLRSAVSTTVGRSALSRCVGQPVDEAGFLKIVTEILGTVPDSLSVKLLWCSLVSGKHLSSRVLNSKNLATLLTSELESHVPRLGHSGSLDFSDDDASSLEMSESYPDMPIGNFSPFATPSGGVKIRLKDSILDRSLGKESELWDAVSSKLESPKKDESKKAPSLQLSGELVGKGYDSAAIRKRSEERTKQREEFGKDAQSQATPTTSSALLAPREAVPTLKLASMPVASMPKEMTTPRTDGAAVSETPRSTGSDTPRRKSLSKRTEKAEVCSAFNAEEVFGQEETQQAEGDEFEAIMARFSRKRTRSLGQESDAKTEAGKQESSHPFRSPVPEAEGASPAVVAVGATAPATATARSPVAQPTAVTSSSAPALPADTMLAMQGGSPKRKSMTSPPSKGLQVSFQLDDQEKQPASAEGVSTPAPLQEAVSAPPPAREVVASQQAERWSADMMLELCSKGEESLFAGKATMLDSLAAPSVPEAVAALNQGKLDGSEDCYVVFAAKKEAYFLIYQLGKRKEALQRFELADSSQGKLTVSVLAARGLSASAGGALPDTLVVVRMSLEEQKTEVVRQSRSPQWTKQAFEFQAALGSADRGIVHFDVLRVGPDGESSLGAAEVQVENLEPLITSRRLLPLSQGGEIDIEVSYSPEIKELEQSSEDATASIPKANFPSATITSADSGKAVDASQISEVKCRSCANTGKDFMGELCSCKYGKALAKPAEKKRLSGLSPLHRPKDFDALFKEADADGDGVLGLEDLRSFMVDYLNYGHAEIAAFHSAHSDGSGVTPAVFKKETGMMGCLSPYRVAKQSDRLIVRKPGAFGGLSNVDFNIEDCTGSTVLICERTAQVFMEGNKSCKILIGPCETSVSARECEDCTFWVACRQFRTRDCKNCTVYLYSASEPGIETSEGLSVAPLTAEYPGLTRQFEEAKLNAATNFWSAIFDFSGRADRANWSIRPLDDCETLVLSFEGGPAPDSPLPPLTQEMLLAKPPESSEGAGQSVANIPQTRPPPPPAPRRKHPETKEMLGRPRRRNLTDRDHAGREGSMDLEDLFCTTADAVISKDDSMEEEIIILDEDEDVKKELGGQATAAPRTIKFERGALSKGDDSDDDILPLRRKGPAAAAPESKSLMSRAKASGAANDSDDDDDASPPKISPAAKKGLQAFFKSAGNPMEDDSDDDTLAKKPTSLTAMEKLAAKTLHRSVEKDDSDDDKLQRGSGSFASKSHKKKGASGKDNSDSDTSESAGDDTAKYMKWAKKAAGSDDSD